MIVLVIYITCPMTRLIKYGLHECPGLIATVYGRILGYPGLGDEVARGYG